MEHRYAATLLACLLTGDPATELGDDVAVTSVQFQAGSVSAVDDLVLEGQDDGGVRRVSIAARRDPHLTASDSRSVPLLGSFLRVVTDEWPAVEAGRWRLCLAVAGNRAAVDEVTTLAVVARTCSDGQRFRERVHQPGVTRRDVRQRLEALDVLVTTAAGRLEPPSEVNAAELTWRLLSALQIRRLRLEGTDMSDRTAAVTRLRSVVEDGTVAAADNLFARLDELAGHDVPSGTRFTEIMLRRHRHLAGVPLRRSPTYAQAWRRLDRAGRQLQDTVGRLLRDTSTTRAEDAGNRLELERVDARDALVKAMTEASRGHALVVTGEPDVGKSALTLRATRCLVDEGAEVIALSLRDLPETPRGLDDWLGGAWEDVVSSTATGGSRLLAIDGAEASLEARAPLFRYLVLGALRAGAGVIAVARSDAASHVRDILDGAAHLCGCTVLGDHVVPGLTDADAGLVVTTFPSLTSLGRDERSRWLLRRPGLVDLLLRAGVTATCGEVMSEADVFAAVWDGLVRRHGATSPGRPGPDERDAAMTALARRKLFARAPSENPHLAALPSLRSDGLLRSGDLPAAWRAEDDFASDLVRDLAVTRLLVSADRSVLVDADDPRWALRAARLACQVRLLRAADVTSTWSALEDEYAGVEARNGHRWSEVPLEAVIAPGTAAHLLGRLWSSLIADNDTRLRTLLRLALQHHTDDGVGDPLALTPIVEQILADDRGLLGGPGALRDQVRELVLVWLRGLLVARTDHDRLRRRVRDAILADRPFRWDEFAVEALATLGPDVDAAGTGFLRSLAQDDGERLWPAVETPGTLLGLGQYQPELLVELAEAYYLDRTHGERWFRLDNGIRDHRVGSVFLGTTWYRGPFWTLLNKVPVEGVALINRMLDHAAAVHVRDRADRGDGSCGATSTPRGVDVAVLGIGARRYVGDHQVWAWYRGSSVGPLPCTSALLAVERFADHLVDTCHFPLSDVVTYLLQDCHNLAMPGLVIGLLVRHLEGAGDLLDPWLAEPKIWDFESSRVVSETTFHRRGREDDLAAGEERRKWSLLDVVLRMVVPTAAAADAARLEALRSVGDRLASRARTTPDNSGSAVKAATVEGWAAAFVPANYVGHRVDGGVVWKYQHPDEVAAVLAPSNDILRKFSERSRLLTTYGTAEDRSAPTDTMIDDIALARRLSAEVMGNGPLTPWDAVVAVAAAVVVAHTRERLVVPVEDLRWAADLLLDAAANPDVTTTNYEETAYWCGADRSAAAALPLLVPLADDLGLDTARLGAGLVQCATSLFDEVRTAFATTCSAAWAAPCSHDVVASGCHHQELWAAAKAGVRDCHGRWDAATDRRVIEPLGEPYVKSLAAATPEALLDNRLVPPLISTAGARACPCLGSEPAALWPVLLEAHARTVDHGARHGYGGAMRELTHTARVLLDEAAHGDPVPLSDYLWRFSDNPAALHGLLWNMAVVFSGHEALRSRMADIWPLAMTTVLDAVDAGAKISADRRWTQDAVAALIPIPQLTGSDHDPDAALDALRASWMDPRCIDDLVPRWLPLARGRPEAVDAVVQLARCAPQAWQTDIGLRWVEQVIDGKFTTCAGRWGYASRWLGLLREVIRNLPDARARWRRLVDGLSAAGDREAAELQRLDE